MALRQEDKTLCDKVETLSLDRQKLLVDEIIQKADSLARTSQMYNHIIATVNPRIITLDEFLLLAKTDRYAKSSYDNDPCFGGPERLLALYAPMPDLVVVFPSSPIEQLRALLGNHMTPLATLAHEALHRIQFTVSGLVPIWRILCDNNLATKGEFTFPQDRLEELSGFLPNIKLQDIPAYLNKYSTEATNIIYELAAYCLTPYITDNQVDFPNLPIFTRAKGGTAIVAQLFAYLTMLFGYHSVQGHGLNFDIELNKHIGSIGNSVKEFKAGVEKVAKHDSEYFNKQGIRYIRRRAEQLEPIHKIAHKVMNGFA